MCVLLRAGKLYSVYPESNGRSMHASILTVTQIIQTSDAWLEDLSKLLCKQLTCNTE